MIYRFQPHYIWNNDAGSTQKTQQTAKTIRLPHGTGAKPEDHVANNREVEL